MTETVRKFHPNEPGSVSGIVYSVLGLMDIQGGLSIAEMEHKMFYSTGNLRGASQAEHTVAIVAGYLIALFGLGLLLFGLHALKMIRDFHKIRKYLGDCELAEIREMAEQLHWKEVSLRRRLKAMIQKNLFLQGHINAESTFFLLTDDLYGQYLDAVVLWKEQQKEWEKLGFQQEQQILLQNAYPVQERIGQAVLREKNEKMKKCMERMERSVERLLHAAAQNPSNLANLHTFLNYFLPTADKLVERYQQLPVEESEMENIKQLQTELSGALEELAEAFERLTAQLCEQLEMEVTSNLYALRIIMEQHRRLGVTA